MTSFSAMAQTLEVRSKGSGAVQPGTMITTGIGISKGKVWVWGYRGSGQQGNGVRAVKYDGNRIDAAPVDGLPTMVSVTGGAYHIMAIDHAGFVYSWGQNLYGEAGCDGSPSKNYVLRPCRIKDNTGRYLQGLSQIVGVGEYHTIYLDHHGDVYTSGLGTLGRLGLGPRDDNARLPTKVNLNGEHARLIGGQYEGSIAVTYEGNVWVWGDNEYMGLAIDYNHGGYNAAKRWIRTPMISTNLTQYAHDIVAIGGGQLWGAALLKDGRMLGWGAYSMVGLKCPADGNKYQNYGVGSVFSPIPQIIPIPDKIVSAVMRYDSTIALSENGEIYTFGTTNAGEYSHFHGHCVKKAPLPESFIKEHGRVVKIGTGKHNVTYEMEDGTAWGTGLNDYGMISSEHSANRFYNWPGAQIKQIPDK